MRLSSQREERWPPAGKYQGGGLSPPGSRLYLCSADTLTGPRYSQGETGTFQQPVRPALAALVMDVLSLNMGMEKVGVGKGKLFAHFPHLRTW